MGLDLPSFADAEEVIYSLLSTLGTVVKGTPVNLVTPVYIIRRIGGHSDYITDYAHIQVTAVGDTRPGSAAMQLAAQRTIENSFATEVTLADNSVVLIDGTTTLTSGYIQPYENIDLREVVGIYEIRMRRPIVAAH
jgi:hypothetical protein